MIYMIYVIRSCYGEAIISHVKLNQIQNFIQKYSSIDSRDRKHDITFEVLAFIYIIMQSLFICRQEGFNS